MVSGNHQEPTMKGFNCNFLNSFANGIDMSPDEQFLIYTETGRAKLHKYYISGPKSGTNEVLVDSLPGLPDNIKYAIL